MLEKFGPVLAFLATLAVIVFALWLHIAGPCSWQQWEPAKDLPARCVTYYVGGHQ